MLHEFVCICGLSASEQQRPKAFVLARHVWHWKYECPEVSLHLEVAVSPTPCCCYY